MARQIKLWNGRAGCCHKRDDPAWSGITQHRGQHRIVAAAYSRADLRRLIAEYCGNDPGEAELREYWNAGAWGNSMNEVTPERGLWLLRDSPDATPLRLA